MRNKDQRKEVVGKRRRKEQKENKQSIEKVKKNKITVCKKKNS